MTDQLLSDGSVFLLIDLPITICDLLFALRSDSARLYENHNTILIELFVYKYHSLINCRFLSNSYRLMARYLFILAADMKRYTETFVGTDNWNCLSCCLLKNHLNQKCFLDILFKNLRDFFVAIIKWEWWEEYLGQHRNLNSY